MSGRRQRLRIAGLDAELVAELYFNASQLETPYSLLVFKNGYLIAEDYFNNGRPDLQVNIQSVTKSITSAVVGLALEDGCLTSLDQKMVEFFPEFEARISDQRKHCSSRIRQDASRLRAGDPWAEATARGHRVGAFSGFHEADHGRCPSLSATRDTGSRRTASPDHNRHLLGIMVARGSWARPHEPSLKSICWSPLGVSAGRLADRLGQQLPGLTPASGSSSTDLAKFGLMYRNEGCHDGEQIISSDWVSDSLEHLTGKGRGRQAWRVQLERQRLRLPVVVHPGWELPVQPGMGPRRPADHVD